MTYRVDKEAGIIYGVRVLGRRSRNNRIYSDQAFADCLKLYEGVSTRFGHETKAYEADVGTLRKPWIDGTSDCIRADWHLKKSHPYSATLLEDAEQSPDRVQLSHEGHGFVKLLPGGMREVTRMGKVDYVAVVTDGATNASLKEELEMTVDELKKAHPELIEQLREEVAKEVRSNHDDAEKRARLISERDEWKAKTEKLTEELAEVRRAGERISRADAIRKEAVGLGIKGELSEELMEAYLDMKPELVTAQLKERAELLSKVEPPERPESHSGGKTGGRKTFSWERAK